MSVITAVALTSSFKGPAARVLLVDDDELTRLVTEQALLRFGFVVVSVEGGAQALQALEADRFDVVALDALMPEMDGFEVCRRIRKREQDSQTPVLILTGLDDERSVAQAYEAGATDFFVKSTTWALLAGRLRYMLRAADTRKQLEDNKARLARAQELARMGSYEWISAATLRQGRLLLSPECARVLGIAGQEPMALKRMLKLIEPADRRGLLHLLREAFAPKRSLSADVAVRLEDGRQRIIHIEAHMNAQGHSGVLQDVTDRREVEDRIRRLADFDALTALPNRRQLLWRAHRALQAAEQQAHPMALLLVDLDRFKVINDTLGHARGDELLVEVSRRLRQCVRHREQVHDGALQGRSLRSHRLLEGVGRLGGDEFVVLLPEISAASDAMGVAQRIVETLREPMIISDREFFSTASVGVAIYPEHGQTVSDLLRQADVAMYAAKHQGRNQAVSFQPNSRNADLERLELESALHGALSRNELFFVFQPKVDTANAAVMGVEALMRWRHGQRIVPPGEFIALAEESGLIDDLSRWAVQQAARHLSQWQRDFSYEGSISVNMPARMFESRETVALIDEVTQSQGIRPECLHVEITESMLIKNVELVVSTLLSLRERGIQLAIDDFGTGYSSLAHLTTLPVSELKIDRSFVSGLGKDSRSTAVVAAVCALAQSLGLRVVAEGVETIAQMEQLQRMGCFMMQGFLFTRPLPSEDLCVWMRAQQSRSHRAGEPWQATH